MRTREGIDGHPVTAGWPTWRNAQMRPARLSYVTRCAFVNRTGVPLSQSRERQRPFSLRAASVSDWSLTLAALRRRPVAAKDAPGRLPLAAL
jgi:hypothetical protein